MTSSEVQPDALSAASAMRRAEAAPVQQDEIVIEAASGWQSLGLHELWRARDLLYFLTWRNVKIRYKQTLLGATWAFLQPVLMMVVFTWTIGRLTGLSSTTVPYPLFVYAGLLPWTFFQTAVTGAANSVVSSEGLVTKVYFPRLVIPLSAVAAALVDFAVAFVVLLGLMAWYGVSPTASLILLPLSTGLVVVAALGIGTLIAALNVAYRDFRYVVTFLVQLWMLATTSIYLETTLPPVVAPVADVSQVEATSNTPSVETAAPRGWSNILRYANPMVGAIEFFRGTVIGTPVHWPRVVSSSVLLTAMMVASFYYFRRVEDSFADVI